MPTASRNYTRTVKRKFRTLPKYDRLLLLQLLANSFRKKADRPAIPTFAVGHQEVVGGLLYEERDHGNVHRAGQSKQRRDAGQVAAPSAALECRYVGAVDPAAERRRSFAQGDLRESAPLADLAQPPPEK